MLPSHLYGTAPRTDPRIASLCRLGNTPQTGDDEGDDGHDVRASLRSSPALRLDFPVMAGPKNMARYLRDASTLRVDVLDPKGPRVVGSVQVPLGKMSAATMRPSKAHTYPPLAE